MSKKHLFCILLLGLAGGGLTFLLFLFPADRYEFWPKCILHQCTGLYCPGCGNTRALSALLHGNFVDSLKMNVLFIPAVIVVVLSTLYPRITYNRVFSWGVTIVVILFFILRNIPCYPFSLLAPH